MQVEHVQVVQAVQAFDLTTKGLTGSFGEEKLRARGDLADFVLAEHEDTQLRHWLQAGHALHGVVVQVEEYEIWQVCDV